MPVFNANPAAFTLFHNEESLFSLGVKQTKHLTVLHMQLFTDMVNTSEIPETLLLLQQHLPTILLAKCFNDEDIPFAIEVQQTEIGHLFEHILLEYLCKLKLSQGYDTASYSGRTYWNWKKNPRGTFEIVIRTGYTDNEIFPLALEKTIQLTRLVIASKVQQYSGNPLPTFSSALSLASLKPNSGN